MRTPQLALLSLFALPLALALPACDDDDSGGDGGGSTSGSTGGPTTETPTTGTPTTSTPTTSTPTTGTPTTEAATTEAPSTGDVEPSTGEPGSTSGSSGGDTGSSSGEGDTEAGSSTGTQQGMADLDMSVVYEDTEDSIYTETVNFGKNACAVQDGCLGGAGARRLLRFDTITPNLGDADFFAGNAEDNPELFEFSECQGSYVLANYARYHLRDGDGNEVGFGHKSAFALIDLAPFTDDAGPAQYGFNGDMGISVGWADIYNAGLDCQWVDITDVPPGDYVLELDINPEEVIEEATFDNNTLQIPVTITAEDLD